MACETSIKEVLLRDMEGPTGKTSFTDIEGPTASSLTDMIGPTAIDFCDVIYVLIKIGYVTNLNAFQFASVPLNDVLTYEE